MLEGTKVRLRPFRRSDIEFVLKWINDQEVTQYITVFLPITEMAEEKYIESLGTTRAGTTAMFVIEAIDGAEPKAIGSMGLENMEIKDHRAEFGIVIGDRDYWSRGYGTEAAELIIRYGFEQLNLHRISSYVFSFNERSIRLHRKVGFIEEGRAREACFRNGSWHDHVLFGLLREEWKAERG